MNILVSTNETYVFPTMVMISSLCRNNGEVAVNVYVLYNDLSKSSIEAIERLHSAQKSLTLHFVYVDAQLFEAAPLGGRTNNYISIETYYRLAAGELLPPDVKRVLYLDTDIIINGSLSDLYNYSFNESTVAVVCEDYGLKMATQLRKEVFFNMKLNEQHRYFNAGVMLINLELLRTMYSLRDFLAFIKDNKDKLIFHDQDVMNKLFEKNLEYVDYNQYNCRPFFYPFTKKYRKMIQKSKIIHYGEKPWNPSFSDMAGNLFWEYARDLGYSDKEKDFQLENKRYFKNNIAKILIKRTKRNLKLMYLRKVKGIV